MACNVTGAISGGAMAVGQNVWRREGAEKLTGSARYIFWAALGVVVVALLTIMSHFLPKPQG